MKTIIVFTVALLLGGVATLWRDDRVAPEVESIVLAELHNVFGGQMACWEEDTPACPETHFCEDECAGLAGGDACAGDGYVRLNPNYRQAMPSDEGKKDTKTISPAKLCGNMDSCGPVCVAIAGGLVCPATSVSDYEVETVPDGDDCDEATAKLDNRRRSELALVRVANGGRFNAFHL